VTECVIYLQCKDRPCLMAVSDLFPVMPDQAVERSGFEPVLVVWFPRWCGECLMGDQPLPDNELFTAAQWTIVIPLYEIYAALSTVKNYLTIQSVSTVRYWYHFTADNISVSILPL